ncbi:hypothetical protein DFP72DRAFT_928381 [Ephemerocybe angulata]|uniref:DUF6533 domain-containing protein n=1 Tax=Ephemerocybe angulata TaxID=980116 RepID=A0A8H6HE73_9AGAR|nr:hypothetical protein DFP72DRAFT_928381 [Tulosesus angulatus]
MSDITLEDAIAVVETWNVTNYVLLATFVGLLYYYVTTFDEEVAKIWPQPTFKLGRILFLALRYSTILAISLELTAGYPAYINMSIPACTNVFKLWWACVAMGNVFAEAIFWICLYALLGGKRKYVYLLGAGFMAFALPIIALQSVYIFPWHAAAVDPFESAILGKPCAYSTENSNLELYPIAAYIAFARAIVIAIVAVVTLFVRYRRHNSSLINVVKREGGMYYISAAVLHFFVGLTSNVGSGIEDRYAIAAAVRRFLIPIFADRLLLKMQRLYYPGTEIVSTMMFENKSHFDRRLREIANETGVEISTDGDGTMHGGDIPIELTRTRTDNQPV